MNQSINMRKFIFTILAALCLSAPAFAQEKNSNVQQKWELGLQAGVMQAQCDMNDFGLEEINPGGGLLLRYHLDNLITLRANLLYGEISGEDANLALTYQKRGFTFFAPVAEGSVMAELDFMGNRRWRGGVFHRTFSPYIFGGAGYAVTSPNTYYNEANNPGRATAIQEDKNNTPDGQFVMPLGLGFRYDISDRWVLGVETGLRVTFNDYIDGVSASGNDRKSDTYTQTSLTLSYRFAHIPDRDKDGIPDAEDPCPDMKGSAASKGCPDTDGDGIADNEDTCPEAKGARNTLGCPDTDGDGIADKSDLCPDQKGTIATAGCPDKDRDGIADSKDACPELAGNARFKGCPDTDNDGIPDNEDACPDKAGTTETKGCPLNDRDRDGITDENDKCPDNPGTAAMFGCPDTDKDGIADNLDKCPDQPGSAMNAGCPALSDADRKILEAAVYGVQFEPAKSVLKTGSSAILDQVADVLKRYPTYQLVISGHTDSDGAEAANLKLSQERAKTCYDYLLGKGIDAKRMTHNGFGESRPVAENKTAAGKAKNRRVEFNLNL